ncbi:MAG TPA: hypothetical protein VH593_11025 [Ktedonobacteraceae bacterium]|jgi:hypothetical protein
MLVHTTLYGTLRIIVGRQVLDLTFEAQYVTIAQLLETLVNMYPRTRPYLFDLSTHEIHRDMRVLVNGKRPQPTVTPTMPLYDNDRLALIVAPTIH